MFINIPHLRRKKEYPNSLACSLYELACDEDKNLPTTPNTPKRPPIQGLETTAYLPPSPPFLPTQTHISSKKCGTQIIFQVGAGAVRSVEALEKWAGFEKHESIFPRGRSCRHGLGCACSDFGRPGKFRPSESRDYTFITTLNISSRHSETAAGPRTRNDRIPTLIPSSPSHPNTHIFKKMRESFSHTSSGEESAILAYDILDWGVMREKSNEKSARRSGR